MGEFKILILLFFLTLIFSCKQKIPTKPTDEECLNALYNGDKIEGDSVYNMPEIYPSFGKGKNDLILYLEKNTHYPKLAKENKIIGKVFLLFIIKKDGEICCIQVNPFGGNLGFGCEEEAFRIVEKMPKWNPGKHKGEIVNSKFSMPVTFGFAYNN